LTTDSAIFWGQFACNARSWANEVLSGGQRAIFEKIDRLLHASGFDFCFDLTRDEDICLLIFSPEGDRAEALKIDEFLGVAPEIIGWRFLGRRQKKELNDASAIVRELYFVDPIKLRYRIEKCEEVLSVYMIVPLNADLTPEEARGMVNTFLWHAVGEERVLKMGIRGEVLYQRDPVKPTISAAELVEAL
jgi:hypothetical protein